MDIHKEIEQLEGALANQAAPPGNPFAAAGRLAELYLQLPDAGKYAARAELLAHTGAEIAGPANPLYAKFRHFEAMAMRKSQTPKPEALGENGLAAAMDRDSYERSLKTAPGEANLFAVEWANWAWESARWNEAAEAYPKASRALRQYLRFITDQQERLKILSGVHYAARAAFALAQLGNPREAILEIERGNDFSFNAQEMRSMGARLVKEHPGIAAHYNAATVVLQSFMTGKAGPQVNTLGQIATDAASAQSERNKIVHEIQALPGFSTFGLPTGWGEIVETAAHGPLVYLAITDKGLAALAVHAPGGAESSAASVAEDLTVETVFDTAMPFLNAEFEGKGDPFPTLNDFLEYLSASVTKLIDDVLSKLEKPAGPVFLQPIGMLSMLPLHLKRIETTAAAQFQPREITYFYWVRGLARSLLRQQEHVADGALVINNPIPLPVQFDPLELADFECAAVLSHVPGIELKGIDADSQTVMDELPKARLAHFCCHGEVDRTLFYSGILILADSAVLTYKHLRNNIDIPARLVVLSACRSGSAALGMDANLSLPAVFLSAGAAAVLGTLWHADEAATALLVGRFYSLWCDGGLKPADALRKAQLWLMSSSAATLRAAIPNEALALHAAERLASAADGDLPFQHPWFWAAFFLAGA